MKPWFRSLTVQISAAMMLIFTLLAGAIGFTLYEVELRKHDYVILNLAGQLRVIAQTMVADSTAYRSLMAGGWMNSDILYLQGLRNQMTKYDAIIAAYQKRTLPAELTGLDEPLTCSWNRQSINQLDRTAAVWFGFETRLKTIIGREPTPESLRAAADAIIDQRQILMQVSGDLTDAFQHMMEGKLKMLAWINRLDLGISLLVVIGLLTLLRRTFIAPLNRVMAGLARVSQGDFATCIEVGHRNEMGGIAQGINHLTQRLGVLFRLTDRINQATTLEASLRFVAQEIPPLLPLDWIGWLSFDPRLQRFQLERIHTSSSTTLHEGDRFEASETLLLQALTLRKPLHLSDLAQTAAQRSDTAPFARVLAADGRGSALFYPLGQPEGWQGVLVLASRSPHAYNQEQLELLANIAGQLGHAFEKTVVTESLLISALEGLAKLAENRDPETGNHLIRMSLYSVLIAEQVSKEGAYQGSFNAEDLRALERFAPMHDIGKVGIPDAILLKAGGLTPEERETMNLHPTIGGQVLRRSEEQLVALGYPVFAMGIEIAEGHHERFDGKGYPRGVAGRAIPLTARIVALADVFDALTSKRPYKQAWSVEEALAWIGGESGGHFDPEVVAAFERALPKILKVYERLKHV
ncbi:MAG: hypothetical protein COX57_10180 [Alphaproteobacteria bacterium CG_4_10_14_0_2_um_filter_63_37]|nr:MAG: hypothetical protein AUJ55_04205 [Proteobacteria bacterium CG1_02_64_396]PJA24147.1 MAG: hypothetical protein COX57_10180 [Alphaproteobacteria bacterium CG_4_10_14_0_2_um_filter_63_37]